MKTRKLTSIAALTAISVVLVLLIHFPIFPPVAFLEYDPADIPIMICGFAFGPAAGIVSSVLASIIQGCTVSAQSGIYGILMHILGTGADVAVASLLYRRNKSRRTALLALGAGALTRVVVMFFANLLITPLFMMQALNSETVGSILLLMPYILLYNVLKSVINGAVTFFIYKSLSRFLHSLGAK